MTARLCISLQDDRVTSVSNCGMTGSPPSLVVGRQITSTSTSELSDMQYLPSPSPHFSESSVGFEESAMNVFISYHPHYSKSQTLTEARSGMHTQDTQQTYACQGGAASGPCYLRGSNYSTAHKADTRADSHSHRSEQAVEGRQNRRVRFEP